MKPISMELWTQFKFLSNLKTTADHSRLAWVVSSTNEKKDVYESNIWVMDASRQFQLTAFNQESFYIWDDADTVLFASKRLKEEAKSITTDFFRIRVDGGEAVKWFTLPLAVTGIEKIDADHYIVSALADVKHPNYHLYPQSKREKLFASAKDEEFYQEIDEAPFYANGQSFTVGQRSRLYRYTVSSDQLDALTPITFNVEEWVVSADKSQIVLIGAPAKSLAPIINQIYALPLERPILTQVTRGKHAVYRVVEVGQRWIALVNRRQTYGMNENPVFMDVDLISGQLTLRYDPYYSVGNSIGADVRLGGSDLLVVYNEALYAVLTVHDHSRLIRLSDEQDDVIVYDAQGSIDGYAFLGDRLIVNGLLDQNVLELYDINEQGATPLTSFNTSVLSEYYVAKPQPIAVSKGNVTINGWVLLPENAEQCTLIGAILDIHGGPKTVYGEVYYHEMQVWASKGFAVLFCNPRGSDGKGNAFADIRGKYGTIDYEDILDFTNAVLDKYPQIDRSRLGVTGGSYGGFMTNWIIGHTDRFACAATQRSICNWTSFHGVSDIGYFFTPDQTGANLMKAADYEQLWWHSPLKYAANFKTPTLVIHSKADYRCPIDQGYQMITALKEQGVPSKMVMFHTENHDLSRSGKPKARTKRLHEITSWMVRYLKP
jgi:dipeptidyl aminopeptidase/acylaminoacyl peptidase